MIKVQHPPINWSLEKAQAFEVMVNTAIQLFVLDQARNVTGETSVEGTKQRNELRDHVKGLVEAWRNIPSEQLPGV